jgi:hypothetical protein
MGLVTQSMIDKCGEMVPKNRLTHNQLFEFSTGTAVNSRVIPDSLTPCRYGTALHRFIHYVVDVCKAHPTTQNLMTKVDFKAAYQRLHIMSDTAAQAVVLIEDMALVALRMTFGGSPNPSIWSDVFELACDTCNMLSRSNFWNAEDSPTFESPHQTRYIQQPVYLPNKVNLGQAWPMTFLLQSDTAPFTECYLDGLFSCFLDQLRQIWQGSRNALLVLHLFG